MQDKVLAILEAMLAQPMRLLLRPILYLTDKGERTRIYAFQLVLLLLAVPLSKLHHLLFKLSYAVQRRRMLLLSRQCALAGLEQLSVDLSDLALNERGVASTYKCTEDVLGRVEAANNRRDRR